MPGCACDTSWKFYFLSCWDKDAPGSTLSVRFILLMTCILDVFDISFDGMDKYISVSVLFLLVSKSFAFFQDGYRPWNILLLDRSQFVLSFLIIIKFISTNTVFYKLQIMFVRLAVSDTFWVSYIKSLCRSVCWLELCTASAFNGQRPHLLKSLIINSGFNSSSKTSFRSGEHFYFNKCFTLLVNHHYGPLLIIPFQGTKCLIQWLKSECAFWCQSY